MSNLESSISEFSFKRQDILSDKNINQNGGCILSDLFGDDDNNIFTLLLNSFTDGRPDIACYILCKSKKCPSKICKKDEYDRNLLHYMTLYASHGNMVIHIGQLMRKCSKSRIKKALNCQDKLGNTPLHYATQLGFNNLVKLFIDCGADPTIKNSNGEYIEEDNTMKVLNIIPDVDKNNIHEHSEIIIISPRSDERLITEEDPLIVSPDNIPNIDNLPVLPVLPMRSVSPPARSVSPPARSVSPPARSVSPKITPVKRELQLFTPTENYDTDNFFNEVEKLLNNKTTKSVELSPTKTPEKVEEKHLRDIFDSKGNYYEEPKLDMDENVDSPTIRTESIINEILSKTSKVGEDRERIEDEYFDMREDMARNISSPKSKSRDIDIMSDIMPNEVIRSMMSEKSPKLEGGAKNKKSQKKSQKNKRLGRLISGERKLITYSEVSVSEQNYILSNLDKSDKSSDSVISKKSDKSNKSDNINEYTITLREQTATEYNYDNNGENDYNNISDVSDIARQINRQSSDIHERAVLKIIEILKLDKNNEKDVQMARNYKAAIYKMVKENNPLLNNFDRAVEMEKSITKDLLKTIDINKVSKEIEKHMSEKSTSSKKITSDKSDKILKTSKPSKSPDSTALSKLFKRGLFSLTILYIAAL